jgi:hypothetical protein
MLGEERGGFALIPVLIVVLIIAGLGIVAVRGISRQIHMPSAESGCVDRGLKLPPGFPDIPVYGNSHLISYSNDPKVAAFCTMDDPKTVVNGMLSLGGWKMELVRDKESTPNEEIRGGIVEGHNLHTNAGVGMVIASKAGDESVTVISIAAGL